MSGGPGNNHIKRLSLNRVLRLASAALAGLIFLSGATGIGAAWMQSSALQRQEEAASLYANHAEADMMHDAIRSDVLAGFEAANPGSKIKQEEVLADFATHVATLNERILAETQYTGSEDVTAVTATLSAPLDAYTRAAEHMFKRIKNEPARAKAMLPDFFEQFRNLEVSMGKASDVISAHASEASTSARRVGTVAIILLILTVALCMAGMALFVVVASRRVIQPIASLAETMRAFGAGNLAVEVQGVDRGDELGDMAKAMLAFRIQLQTAEASKAAQAQLIVESLGAGLTELACGNLSAEVTENLQAPFAQLKENFNSTVASLRGLIQSVTLSASMIRTGTEEIAHASEDLARRTEGSAASLEETSAAIAQMDQRLHTTATSAGQTLARAGGARASVASGRNVAEEAVQAMQRVSESAKGIDGVIEGLDKIAFQTRVLAMNAAVEAGRAGEAGKGFAVVADLVSALAMRAEEEAARARGQLTATQDDIGIAVERVKCVDDALLNISHDVDEVHDLLTNITTDNQAQSTAITQISAAVGELDHATQQNAAMVEETSATARNLTAEVTALVRNTEKFKDARTASRDESVMGQHAISHKDFSDVAHITSSTFYGTAAVIN